MGISGDYPLVLIEVHNAADASRAEPYMRLHRSLRLGGLTTELAVVYSEGGDYDTPVLSALREAARAVRCEDTLGIRGGIHLINRQRFSEEALRPAGRRMCPQRRTGICSAPVCRRQNINRPACIRWSAWNRKHRLHSWPFPAACSARPGSC